MRKIKDRKLRKILKEIKAQLDEALKGDYQLLLFGSRSRGDWEKFSDVDLMVILNDAANNFQTKEKIRDIIYNFSLATPYLFSVIIVPESLADNRKGFLVFDSVEKEGIII